jgi:hypothetical protein
MDTGVYGAATLVKGMRNSKLATDIKSYKNNHVQTNHPLPHLASVPLRRGCGAS